MKKRKFLQALTSVLGAALIAASVQAQDPFMLDERGGVEVWSVPQANPGPGYAATNIVLRSAAGTKLVTFENLNFDGELVQTWLSGPFGSSTPKDVVAGDTYPAEWVPYDSHLNITSSDPNMIGGQAGDGFVGIDETNDMTIGLIPGLPQAFGSDPVSGIGPITMVNATDAFFLDTDFQTNEVNVAYLVEALGPDAAGGHVTMTAGVLGEGITNSGEPGGAQWGFGENPDPLNIKFRDVGPVDTFCSTSTADVCIDFESPVDGLELTGNSVVKPDGGKPYPFPDGVSGGFLSVTDALNGQRGAVLFPDLGGGGRLAFGGRTGGANGNHHIDNVQIDSEDGSLWITAHLRVGGGTERPADGFSFNFARPDDPVFSEDGGGLGEGWAASPAAEANLPEEGTTTGIAIGFDEWQSGPEAPEGTNPTPDFDVVGLSVRVDNELLAQYNLPTLNGALDDITSLQTGPLGPNGVGDGSELGWAKLEIHIENIGEGGDYSNITGEVIWKGQSYAIPEPGSISLLGMGAMMFLGLFRRRK